MTTEFAVEDVVERGYLSQLWSLHLVVHILLIRLDKRQPCQFDYAYIYV